MDLQSIYNDTINTWWIGEYYRVGILMVSISIFLFWNEYFQYFNCSSERLLKKPTVFGFRISQFDVITGTGRVVVLSCGISDPSYLIVYFFYLSKQFANQKSDAFLEFKFLSRHVLYQCVNVKMEGVFLLIGSTFLSALLFISTEIWSEEIGWESLRWPRGTSRSCGSLNQKQEDSIGKGNASH